MSPVVEVVRTYLELRSPEQLRPVRFDDPAVRVVRRDAITTSEYRRLYALVGDAWHWHDRDVWPDERLAEHLARGEVSVWECLVGDETAGYFELERHLGLADDDSVEVVYFGLAANFIGRGLGKALLTRAAEEAWALAPARVWLHTCTLDSPRALPNYLARGFTRVSEESYVVQLSDDD